MLCQFNRNDKVAIQFFGSALAKIGISLTEMIVAMQFFGSALTKTGITVSLAEKIESDYSSLDFH